MIEISTCIFGISFSTLCAAIAEVESDGGVTSYNVYQIEEAYVNDVNRILKRVEFCIDDCLNPRRSEEMMWTYWRYYGTRYFEKTGLQPSEEVLARIHNGGPSGWKKKSTEKFWQKVKAALERIQLAKTVAAIAAVKPATATRFRLCGFPCSVRTLEDSLHRVCDHHGLWNSRMELSVDGSGELSLVVVDEHGSGRP